MGVKEKWDEDEFEIIRTGKGKSFVDEDVEKEAAKKPSP